MKSLGARVVLLQNYKVHGYIHISNNDFCDSKALKLILTCSYSYIAGKPIN
jgi:hypothetical protein